MSKLTIPVQYIYTKGDKVFRRAENSMNDTKESELWLPINFYWESRMEMHTEASME